MTSLIASRAFCGSAFRMSARIRAITSLARFPSRIMRLTASRASSRSGRLAAEPAQAGIAVGDDAGERLIDFVGDRGRQLSQRHHPRDVREFRLRSCATPPRPACAP